MSSKLVYQIRADVVEPGETTVASFLHEIAEWYLSSQQDPMIGAQTGTCTFSNMDGIWIMSSTFPISIDFPEKPELLKLDWDSVSDIEPQTNALWKYSIGYLPVLLELSGNFELVGKILETLWDYTNSDDWRARAKWMTSLDHCIAVRIRALCTLHVKYAFEGVRTPNSLLRLLTNDVLNLLEDREYYFPVNNHGAMAAISLVHFCGVFPTLAKQLSDQIGHNVLQFSLTQLTRIINSIFDEFGIPNENSPEYHHFWVILLHPFSTLFDVLPPLSGQSISDFDITKLLSLLDKAVSSLQMFKDTSGKLIPIGDTRPLLLADTGTAQGTLITEENGFAIYRGEDMVLTVNSGSVNYAHKHCDDSSITLSIGGENLILDAGYYSHDWNDPKAIYAKSQSAHSGLFLTELDNLHPGKLYWPGAQRVKASLTRLSTEKFHVRSSVTIDDCVNLEREVLMSKPNQIDISDSVDGKFSEYGSIVRRFLVPLDAQTKFEKGYLEFVKGNILLEFYYPEQVAPVSLLTCQTAPNLKGWVATNANELTPAKCIEIPIVGTTKATTRIRIKRLNRV